MAGDLTGVTLELLEEVTVSWSRGDNPDPRSVLARAPEQDRDDLRDLIDRFLRSQPAVGLTEDSLGLIRQIGLAAEGGSQPRDAAAPGEADMILERAKLEAQAIISQAREAVELAKRQAAEIVEQAHREARQHRVEVEGWADSVLSTLEANLDKFLTATRRGRERLHDSQAESVEPQPADDVSAVLPGRRSQ